MKETKPLHVLILLNSIGGGATQGIREMITTMPKDLVNFYLIFPEQPVADQSEWLHTNVSGWKSIKMDWWNKNLHLPVHLRVIKSLVSNLKSVFRLRHVVSLCRLIRDWRIDIVYTGTSLNIEGAIAAKITGKPHIWHMKETFGKGGRVKFPIPDHYVPQLFLLLSNKVIVMTNYIRTFFGDLQDHDKLVVVYDSVSSERFTSTGEDFRRKLGLERDDLLIAKIASLSSIWKQHELFLKIAALLKDKYPHVKFALFGPEPKKYANPVYNTPWNYYQALKGTADNLKLNNSIIWGGFHSNIPELMASLDMLVHTCDTEPFGRIAIEAMVAGKAVVGPDCGGIAETIQDRETGYLATSGSEKSFAQAIEFLINNPDERKRIGDQAKVAVKNGSYNQQTHNQKMLDIFSLLRK
ncbi:MAG: glycosyltransferase family 4 protein [Cyclobacteriaceae bacterium]|nr:glycosyltransferase family 4 protein [Cyclobacteriaceae bacterium]